MYICACVRLASLTEYRAWKQYCKFAKHVWGLHLVEEGLSAIGKKIASLASFSAFDLVPNLQYCFDSRKGWPNDVVIRASAASRELSTKP